MMIKIKEYFSLEFVKFFAVSTFAAGVNFTARIIADWFTNYLFAIIIAFCFGLLTAFTLNRRFVFKEGSEIVQKQLFKFTVVNLIGLLQTIVFSFLFRDRIFPLIGMNFFRDEIAHLIGLGIPMITNFMAHKYISFKK